MVTTRNGARRITTHEAQVKTATVEVKALTISGKQVTLSVFRQLLDENLMDEQTADLRGVPWGRVNYYFGECKPDHLHVVWQKGNELRRACVVARPPYNPWQEETNRAAGDLHVWRLMADDDLRIEDAYVVETGHGAKVGRAKYRAARAEAVTLATVPVAAIPWLRWRAHLLAVREGRIGALTDAGEPGSGQIAARDQTLIMLTERWAERSNLEAAVRACRAKYTAFCGAWTCQYDALAALDQLFIAV